MRAALSSARSMASPATRDHNQPAMPRPLKMPRPLVISRRPSAGSKNGFGLTPISRASARGAKISAAPSARLNQPRLVASDSFVPDDEELLPIFFLPLRDRDCDCLLKIFACAAAFALQEICPRRKWIEANSVRR